MSRIVQTLALIVIAFQVYSQWTWINPLPQGNTLHSVFALDSITCWAAGGYGTIMKTTDGGVTWTILNTETLETFSSLFFTDSLNGWAGCYVGKIFHTNDGGTTWELQMDDGSSDLMIYNLSFTSPYHGCAVGSIVNLSIIIMTWDGGVRWVRMPLNNSGGFRDVCFADSLHGWIGSRSGQIFSTKDGGRTWENQLDIGSFKWMDYISFVDTLNGMVWENSDGDLYITNDGGTTWTAKHPNFCIYDMCFIDANTGYVCGNNWINKTVNGGATWSTYSTFDGNATYSLSFTNPENGWLCGTAGAIFHFSAGNSTWTRQTSEFTHHSLSGLSVVENGRLAWAAGAAGTIIFSEDYFETWGFQNSVTDEFLYDIEFVDALNGWACGNEGTLVNTTDGGMTWTIKNIPTLQTCHALSVTAFGNVVIVCDSGLILRTTDHGSTWIPFVPIPASDLLDVCFTDSLHGWAIGEGGSSEYNFFILSTLDGGDTWDSSLFHYYTYPHSVYFSDNQHGWVLGDKNILLKTVDGGSSWELHSCPKAWASIYFFDENNGVLGGPFGELYKTSNGGLTFDHLPSGTNNTLSALWINSTGDVWAVGGSGSILLYPQIFNLTTVQPVKSDSLNILVYPVPAGNFIHLEYFLPERGQVDLSLYGLSGQIVYTKNINNQEPGNHKVTIPTGTLQRGIYFCAINTVHNKNLKKIIIQ